MGGGGGWGGYNNINSYIDRPEWTRRIREERGLMSLLPRIQKDGEGLFQELIRASSHPFFRSLMRLLRSTLTTYFRIETKERERELETEREREREGGGGERVGES